MKDLQNLAYTLKRSGFDKQAARVYSLIKTASLEQLKEAIKDAGGEHSENATKEEFESLIVNFKGWFDGKTIPGSVGKPAEKYLKSNGKEFIDAVEKLKELYPNVQKIQNIGTSSDSRNNFRFAYGSLIKLINNKGDMKKAEFTEAEAEKAYQLVQHINGLQTPVAPQPAQPAQPVQTKPAITVDTSPADMKKEYSKRNDKGEVDLGGQSDAIKNLIGTLYRIENTTEIQITKFSPSAKAFDTKVSGIYDEDGTLKKASGAIVEIKSIIGNIGNFFKNVLFRKPHGSNTFVAQAEDETGAAIVYGGNCVVGLPRDAAGKKAELAKSYQNIKAQYSESKDLDPRTRYSYRLMGYVLGHLKDNPDKTASDMNAGPSGFDNDFPTEGNDALNIDSSKIKQPYVDSLKRFSSNKRVKFPVYFVPSGNEPLLGSVKLMQAKAEGGIKPGIHFDPDTGKIKADNITGGQTLGGSKLCIIMPSPLLDGITFTGPTSEAMRDRTVKDLREQGGIINQEDRKTFLETLGQMVTNTAEIASRSTGTRFAISKNTIQKVLNSISNALKDTDIINALSKLTNVRNSNSYTAFQSLFESPYVIKLDTGFFGPKQYEAKNNSVLDLTEVEIDEFSIKAFNTLILSGQYGVSVNLNKKLISFYSQFHPRDEFQQANIFLTQAIRLCGFLAKLDYLRNPIFNPLRIEIFSKIPQLVKAGSEQIQMIVDPKIREKERQKPTEPIGDVPFS